MNHFSKQSQDKSNEVTVFDVVAEREPLELKYSFTRIPINEVLDFFGLYPSDEKVWILDGGCGFGEYGHELAIRGYRVVACDLSYGVLSRCLEASETKGIASRYYLGGCLADLESLPFRGGSFDWCFLGGVLHHFVQVDGVIAELARVGRLGVYAVEPNGSNPLNRLFRYLGKKFLASHLTSIGGSSPNETLHTSRDYNTAFEQFGFSDILIEGKFPCRYRPSLRFELSYASVLLAIILYVRGWLMILAWKCFPQPYNVSLLLIRARRHHVS